MWDADPWKLPSPYQFIREVVTAVWSGRVLVSLDGTAPDLLPNALFGALKDDLIVMRLDQTADNPPLVLLAELLGEQADLARVAACSGYMVFVDLTQEPPSVQSEWRTFLGRYARQRAQHEDGLSLVAVAPQDFDVPDFVPVHWDRRLRRSDALIWAEYHVPPGRSQLFQDMAVTLATELCGWRLDLIADLVVQREEDILSPHNWLKLNEGRLSKVNGAVGRREFLCPIRLCIEGEDVELDQRIWRAQLTSIFPWLEEHRLRLIATYRTVLQLDEKQTELGVDSIENIEFGGLHSQLRYSVSPSERERIRALRDMRNCLAHRKPVKPADFRTALDLSSPEMARFV